MKERHTMTLTSVVPIYIFIFAFLLAYFYISLRIFQCLKKPFPDMKWQLFSIASAVILTIAFMSFVRSSLHIGTGLKYALNIYGGYWMGLFVYLFLLFAAADIVLLVLGAFHVISLPADGYVRFVSGIAVMSATLIIVIGGTLHANNFVHRSYEAETEKNLGGDVKLVLVSDIHLGAVNSEYRLEKLIREINSAEPDIVCIAGDIFDNDFYAIRDSERCSHLLKSIKSEYGIYATLGNHDTGKTQDKMKTFLSECGIRLLEESGEVVDGRILVVGRSYGAKCGDVEKIIAGESSRLPVIVIDHSPAQADGYQSPVDLVLCGHTHRGQIFPGSMFTKRLFPVDFGQYRKDGTSPAVIVSSGAGTWGMPMRVGTDSEVVTVTLKQK